MALKIAGRSDLSSFMVMDVMQKAEDLEARGEKVIHLEVGQPSSGAPKAACKAIVDALGEPSSHGYTLSLGIPSLRNGIAAHYDQLYNVRVKPENVIVTVGSSLGFAMAFLTCFDHGDTVAMTNPGYAAYRNLMMSVGLRPMMIDCRAEQGWKLSVADLDAMDPVPDGIIIASPANPTGVVLNASEMAAITGWCDARGVRLISDEIYHGITFDVEAATALATSSDAIVVNSFSKYFSMTGHRVGWMIAPDNLVDPLERLAQNCVISVPTLSQIAAAAAISDPSAKAELEEHVRRYKRNRDILLNGLDPRFLGNAAPAEGAFYIYADTSEISDDSMNLADRLLNEAHVATTPGLDFDTEQGRSSIRISFAGTNDDMQKAVRRINAWVRDNPGA